MQNIFVQSDADKLLYMCIFNLFKIARYYILHCDM